MWDEKLPLNRKIQLIGPTTLFLVMPHSTLEKAMAPHSSTLAWKIPWAEEPGGLQSVWSLESDTTERLHFPFSVSCIGEGNGNPLQCSCLENPRDGGAWWAAVHGVAQSQAQLKRLSSSSIAHGVLVPQPGIETVTPAVEPTTGLPGNSQVNYSCSQAEYTLKYFWGQHKETKLGTCLGDSE